MRLPLGRRGYLSAMAGPTTTGGWEMSVAAWLRGPLLAVGWGWDAESPIRPWPTLNARPYRGVPRVVVSCLGFFGMVAFAAPGRVENPPTSPARGAIGAT